MAIDLQAENEEGYIEEYISLEKLKIFLLEHNIGFTPYSQEAIDEVKKKVGGMPKELENYYLEIGWFNDIEMSGMGNYIWPLDQLNVFTPQDYFDEIAEEGDDFASLVQETHAYLEFAGEAVSVDVFAFRMDEIDNEDPKIYGWGDSYEELVEEGYYYCHDEDFPSLQSLFYYIALAVEEL